MTDKLRLLLNPGLFKKQPIWTKSLTLPKLGEKVYCLSEKDIGAIRDLRGEIIDLHPGMGGIAPDKLISMIDRGIELTSLDFMLTKGCNFECPYCFANSGPAQKEYIPLRILRSVVSEAVDLGTSLFVLTGGEPLIYKDPELPRQENRGDHFFAVVEMILNAYGEAGKKAKILTFDDVALITPEIAKKFAEYEVGLCAKADTLIPELQDFKVNQAGAFKRMQRGYKNLMVAGYGKNPNLNLVVNSVLDQTTFDGMVDLHIWVMENGFDHSIVPVHYCGSAENEDQEAGIHSPHVKVLYDLISRIDRKMFGVEWMPWSAFTFNKSCNRNRSGLHIRANGDVTACSESPGKNETERYTFGNVFSNNFSLREIVQGPKLYAYRKEFAQGYGIFVCSPQVCDLYAHNLCQGGCATRSAYSKIDLTTGLVVKNTDSHNYSERREDPLCPAWTVLAQRQGILKEGLLGEIHKRLLEKSKRIKPEDFPFIP
ncbi:radical SAM protein [Patescibacteria group bacterium]|nr:radical SAM protein [Patescibacteria group bacterium]